jgi:P-type E1-E2 ATPase
MMGDGANDAIAFQAANTGIAVQGCIELGLRNSDLVLTRPGLRGVLEAYHISRKAMRVVRLNFAVTLTYNILAGSLAALGLMQPLWAAVLMPLSALSVFAITQWRLREDTP